MSEAQRWPGSIPAVDRAGHPEGSNVAMDALPLLGIEYAAILLGSTELIL